MHSFPPCQASSLRLTFTNLVSSRSGSPFWPVDQILISWLLLGQIWQMCRAQDPAVPATPVFSSAFAQQGSVSLNCDNASCLPAWGEGCVAVTVHGNLWLLCGLLHQKNKIISLVSLASLPLLCGPPKASHQGMRCLDCQRFPTPSLKKC